MEIHHRLLEVYGERAHHPQKDAVSELVNTILSQNTNDQNRDVAYEQLRDRFPTWGAVKDAPTEEVVEAIRPAGLAATKAPRIQEALRRIEEERGELSLDFLNQLPLEEARDWLTDIKGVGPKTSAIVLLFALERPAFPVDTHVHRVTQRIGLIPRNASREKAHKLLEDLLPEEIYYNYHLNLIAHGREICHARNPECGICPVRHLCDYYHRQQEGKEE